MVVTPGSTRPPSHTCFGMRRGTSPGWRPSCWGRKPLTGTEKLLPCQLLLIAVGFLGPQDYVPEAFGLTRTPCSTVQTAEGGYSTNIPGVFTAGDMRRGQSLVVWAIREGREAAWEVDRYLMGHGEWTELPLIQTD